MLYRSDKRNSALRDLFILCRGFGNFHAASSATMELLPLKVLDFGLQTTGPRQIEDHSLM